MRAKLDGQYGDLRKEYNWLTRDIRRKVKRDRENWLSDQCEEARRCSEKNQTRGLYQKIKKIAGKVELKISTVKDKHGVTIEDDEKKSGRRSTSVSSTMCIGQSTEAYVLSELPATNTTEDEMPDFLIQKVRSAEANLKPRKAPHCLQTCLTWCWRRL